MADNVVQANPRVKLPFPANLIPFGMLGLGGGQSGQQSQPEPAPEDQTPLLEKVGRVLPGAIKTVYDKTNVIGAIGSGLGKVAAGMETGTAAAPSLLTPYDGKRFSRPDQQPAPTAVQSPDQPVPTAAQKDTVVPPVETASRELPRGDLAPSLLANQPTGSVGGRVRATGKPYTNMTNRQNVPADKAQIGLLPGGDRFLGDVADIQKFAGPDQQVKGMIAPNKYGGNTSSVAYVSNKTPQAPVAPPLEGQARADLLNKVGGGGVLSTNQTEVDLLNRMRREGAQGSATTRERQAQAAGVTGTGVQAQQYDMFGKRLASDQIANQQSIIQSQGQAAAMPAEAQARGAVGAAAEQAKAAQASLQAAQEYRKEEKDADRQARLQLALQTSYERQGQKATEVEAKRHLSQSNMFEKAFLQEAMDPVKQLGHLSGVVQSMKDANHPDWKTHRDTVFQSIALPMAAQIAPKATPEQQDAIAKVLVGNGGNVNKLPKELLALVTVK